MREAPKFVAGSEIKAGQFVSMTAAGTVVPSVNVREEEVLAAMMLGQLNAFVAHTAVLGDTLKRGAQILRKCNSTMRRIWRVYGRGRKPKGLRKHIRREKAARRTA